MQEFLLLTLLIKTNYKTFIYPAPQSQFSNSTLVSHTDFNGARTQVAPEVSKLQQKPRLKAKMTKPVTVVLTPPQFLLTTVQKLAKIKAIIDNLEIVEFKSK